MKAIHTKIRCMNPGKYEACRAFYTGGFARKNMQLK